VEATQSEEKIKREEGMKGLGDGASFNGSKKAVAFFTFSCSMSASTVWKTTLENRKSKTE
jgi:hypothetical protein